MFSLNASIRYYLYSRPTDMRKGFYTLSGIVTNLMGHDVCDGSAFIFLNRSLDSLRILHMEYGGLALYCMKLETGRFRLPFFDMEANTPAISTTWQELVLMIEGKNLSGSSRRSGWKQVKNRSEKTGKTSGK